MRGGKGLILFLSTLPVPKSNRYIRRRDGKVFKPPRVSNWEARALWEIKSQFNSESLKKPLSVEVIFFLPDNRKRDIDNMLKTLWDILERAGVIENDNLIYETKTLKVYGESVSGTVIVLKPFRNRRGYFEKMKKLLSEFKISLQP